MISAVLFTFCIALLQRALRLNKLSKELWFEYFKLELKYYNTIRERLSKAEPGATEVDVAMVWYLLDFVANFTKGTESGRHNTSWQTKGRTRIRKTEFRNR